MPAYPKPNSNQAYQVIASLPRDLDKLHLTFVVFPGPVVATFASDNAEHLMGWWAVQCAKLVNPDRKDFSIVLNKRQFTALRDPETGLPVKRLSSCRFDHGGKAVKLRAAETRSCFLTDHEHPEAGHSLPPPRATVFVDF